MNSEEFIQKLDKANDKNKFIKQHLKTNYVDFTEKLRTSINIVKDSNYKDINGKSVYWRNTPRQLFLYRMNLVRMYLDVELNESNLVGDYDIFSKNNFFDSLILVIPNESMEFQMILDMINDDEEYNVRSLPSFLETKFESMNLLMSEIENKFNTEQ